jgi:putative membrane protein (TIGR04086 family)
MGRSIGAVVVGLLYAIAGNMLAWVVLSFTIPQESETDPIPEVRLLLMVASAFVSAAVGGFMSAHVARRRELAHGLALGAALVVLLGGSALALGTEEAPPWYPFALPAVAFPGTLLGAYLRARVPRPPPPAPPKPAA